ncbi:MULTISPECIES: AbrB/MazE/SpoVT family DNA-binding domain-containing protein [Vibrio]|jgi:antitoxin component of MazEF toxin-antitoxin module|uniref:AbrB/MazE/SpoVT family DNA-binding domain-containing protein n=1 Tax=Vibrio TaxID=662 RepID=UPI000E682D2C|nr:MULTISPECIES: AbrB/MazE/SpoVT family DNA-binding domain-containing protein [Vibrio]EKO3892288.1 AbrB/MazE/SpoVT family DNA-binding domain-containing protein [Vibrio metschnikovii]MCG3731594.1 AbrB/MazE/SpoVT family DNA-binding domain-containing protein [Vibrio cincinnatiensis]
MEKTLTKVGNSTGFTIPAEWLSEMNLKQGSKINVVRERDGIFIQPLTEKPKFNIKELMANTDFEAQRNDSELQLWNKKPSLGRENV